MTEIPTVRDQAPVTWSATFSPCYKASLWIKKEEKTFYFGSCKSHRMVKYE